jgi:ABC-type spermidine/putrescine transport system permease subunit II
MIIYFLITYLFIYLPLECEMYWSFNVKCKYKPTYYLESIVKWLSLILKYAPLQTSIMGMK